MKQKIPVLILITISLILLAVITPSYLHNRAHEISNNQLVASHVFGLIEGNIERPIGITTGLSSDEFLIRALEREDKTNEKEMEAIEYILKSVDSSKGGRDILNAINDRLLDPLAMFLFENKDDLRSLKGSKLVTKLGKNGFEFSFDE